MAETVAKYCPSPEVKDLVLWTDPKLSGGIFGGVTLAYYLLEKSGYTVLALGANASLFIVVVSFLWANLATLVGRSQPPIPDIHISEAVARDVAEKTVGVINGAFKYGHTVLTGSNMVLSAKTAAGLYFAAKIGNWFHFLTFVYMGVFFAFVFPKVYTMKQKEIDNFAGIAIAHMKTSYQTIEQALLSKIPKAKDQ